MENRFLGRSRVDYQGMQQIAGTVHQRYMLSKPEGSRGSIHTRPGAVETMRQAFERRRDLIVKLAKEVPGLEVNVPQGAFYLFPKCNSYFGKSNGTITINNSTDFAMYLLEEAHVATVGGDAFGDPDCFRMSYATSDENIVEAIRRIKEALGKLK